MDPATAELVQTLVGGISGGSGGILILGGVVALRTIKVAERAITLLESLRRDLCPGEDDGRKAITIIIGRPSPQGE